MTNIKYLFFICCLLNFSALKSQNILTLEAAVQQALESSFEVKIAASELTAAKMQDFKGNANEIAVYNLAANNTGSAFGINQLLVNGTEINRFGISNNLNLNAGVSYPIFNSFRVKATKNRILAQTDVAQTRLKSQLQNVAAAVILRYFDLVRQQNLLLLLQKTVAVSEKRLELVKTRLSVGMANNADVYLAEIDMNTRNQELNQQKNLLIQSMIDLNTLMNRPRTDTFSVTNDIPLASGLSLDIILTNMKKNPDLQNIDFQIKVSEFNEQEVYALRQPQVRLNAGFGYNLNNSTAGFSLLNQNYGPNGGISLTLPLFQNQIFDRQHQIAKIGTETRKLQKQSLEATLEGNAYRLWQSYQAAISRLEGEAKNLDITKKYLDLTLQRYELNQANAVDLREAQRAYEDAVFRLLSVRFLAKQSETELLRIAAQLVKE